MSYRPLFSMPLLFGLAASLSAHDGDPFESTFHCVGTIINGQVFADGPH